MIVRGHAVPANPAEPGVTRQVLGHDAELMMCRIAFEQGAVGSLHSHPHRQVTFVARGRFEVTLGDEIATLDAGDCWFVPPGVVHGARAIEAGVLIDVFSPARRDFLDREAAG